MQSWFRRVATVAVVGVLFALGAGTLSAQGVTTAAVSGTVKQESGAAVEGAIVTITNRATGAKLQATSQANGRFYLENVPVGGPYTIEARAIGFEAARRDNVTLALGQRFVSDFALKAQVVQVEEIAVSAWCEVESMESLERLRGAGCAGVVSGNPYPLLAAWKAELAARRAAEVAAGNAAALQSGPS